MSSEPKIRIGDPIGAIPDWKPHEAPMMPGSPSTPDFPSHVRLRYGLIGGLIGVTGSLGNALMTVNLSAVQGALGLDPVHGAWIGSTYAMAGIAMNLVLIKYRQQFGIRSFVRLFLGLYAFSLVLLPFFANYEAVLTLRAINGFAGAAITTFSVFYMLQAFPNRLRLLSLIWGIGLVQVGFPLAGLISPTLLDVGSWKNLFVFQAGLALACVAAVEWRPLPQGAHYYVFEKKDILSFILLASGLALLCAAVGQGRIQWWLEAPWIGWALAGAIMLFVVAAIREHYRDNSLIDTRWVFTPAFVRFGFSILLVRVLLSEQTFAAPVLLQTVGMGPEQMQMLYGVILLSVMAGIAVSALLVAISPKFILFLELAAPALIAVAAFIDTSSTSLTHPQTFALSQAILGFAGAMFVCAAFLLGFLMLLSRGLGSVITFIVTFSAAQMFGGLLGPAILGSFQVIRMRHHLGYLSEAIVGSDPSAASTQNALRALLSSVITDPAALQVSSLSTMAQQIAQQANILALNDVFLVVAFTALVHLVLSIPVVIAIAKKMKTSGPPKPQSARVPA